jgi:dihydropteroate synthase
VAIAVDTFRAATAAAALDIHRSLEPGCPPVDAVNDISGATLDPAMADVLAAFKPGFVLCHCPAPPAVMQRAPRYDNVVDQVEAFFDERLRALTAAGLPEANICLDPGIGFGKSPRHNLALMAAAPRFARLGRPLYYGVSRKSLFAQFPLEDRDPPTMAAVALLAALGVAIHRVHNVPAAVAALGLAEALKGEGRSEEG